MTVSLVYAVISCSVEGFTTSFYSAVSKYIQISMPMDLTASRGSLEKKRYAVALLWICMIIQYVYMEILIRCAT